MSHEKGILRQRLTVTAGDSVDGALMAEISVWVKPGSRKGPQVRADGENGHGALLTVFVRERAVDGKANLAVIAVLADYFQVPKSEIEVLHGRNSRLKRIRVHNTA
jgi:hypothetical protein